MTAIPTVVEVHHSYSRTREAVRSKTQMEESFSQSVTFDDHLLTSMMQEAGGGREMQLLEERAKISKLNTQLDRVLFRKADSILDKARKKVDFPRSRDLSRHNIIFEKDVEEVREFGQYQRQSAKRWLNDR